MATIPIARRVTRVLLGLLVVAAFVLLLRWIKNEGLFDRVLQWIQSLGPWAPAVFVLLYVATVLVFLPAAILTAGGGLIFGFTAGGCYVLLAATIAANLCFLIARFGARDWFAHKLAEHPRFKGLDDATAREGWKIVALVRLAPVFPFSITSYAFGITRVPLRQYFLANFAMIPGTLMYVYFGSVARDLTDRPATPPWLKWTAGALALVALFYITRFARRALAQKVS